MTANDHDVPALLMQGPVPAGEIAASPFDAALWQAIRTQEAIQKMTGGDIRLKALKAFVALNIAAILGDDDHLTSGEIADICKADAALMARFLYAMHAYGVVTTDEDGRYGLTPLGQALQPGSAMWAALGVITSPLWQQAGDSLADTIRAGHPAILGGAATPYPLVTREPDLGPMFDVFMSGRTAGPAAALAARDYSDVRTVADLGGGDGTLLATILTAHPHLNGILVERADVAARADLRLTEQGLAGRVQVITRDIFDDVCPSADRIIVSSVLHNRDDSTNVTLLRAIRYALEHARPRAQLWCVEMLLPEAGIHTSGTDLDLRMMAMFPGGQERTLRQYQALLASAGLNLIEGGLLPGNHTLMIAAPDGA
ncbi:methyltransferase [Nonomuraea sp. CA-143628]|uniref:methyltransferase n=1 Tax=Nonomuraea sp. CA-143628 TaxID=3239997 RepID=UPI003D94BB68